MKKNFSLEKINDLAYLLRRPLEEIVFEPPEKIIEALRDAEQKITVHLYSVTRHSRMSSDLLSLYRYSSQIHLALKDNQIFACLGYGNTSQGRENHNHCLDLLLQDRKLRKKIPTAVIVTHRRDIVSYYYHDSFAYINHDIDSNWHQNLHQRLPRARVPYSQRRSLAFRGGMEIYFNDNGKESLLYKAVEEDIWGRKISERLNKLEEEG